jgi:hypothetical protein
MKSKMGKEVLLAEIKKRTQELELRNKAQESKYQETTTLLENLNKTIEEKQLYLTNIDAKKAKEEQRVKEELKLAIAEYETQWAKLSEQKSQEAYAIIQFDDGTYDITNVRNLKLANGDSIVKAYNIVEHIKLADTANSEMLTWVNDNQLPKDIYYKLAKASQPLPRQLYIDQRQGKAWSQLHIRGIEPEKAQAVQEKKMELWQALIGQSAHIDLRIDYGLDKLVQYVITENNIPSMVNMLKGTKRQTINGVMNVQHSKVVSKPSAEPPEGPDRFYKAQEEIVNSIDEPGAKLAQSLDIADGSYWIEPGGIGATVNTYSYMMLIWEGKVFTGTERHDLHELFMYKDKANDDLFNGKFTVKCLSDGKINRWEMWKAITDPKPMDPIMHSDCGYHWLVPEEKVDGLGREYYRKMSVELFNKKLG